MNRWSKAFLVALRIAVGWHFLYEGLWKIDSDRGATAYATSWYPLQSSIGRLRDAFESSGEVKIGPAAARADAWYDEIVKVFKGRNEALAEDQKARLADLRDKIKLAAADAATGDIRANEIINFDWIYVRDEVLKLPPAGEAERFTALPFLQQSAGPLRPAFRALVPDIDGIERLTVYSAEAALDRRCAEIARHYRFDAAQQARLAQARDTLKAAIAATLNDPPVSERLDDYKAMRKRLAAGPPANAPFSEERRAEDRKKLDQIAGELLALVNEPQDELAVQAQTIASVRQLAAGPLPALPSPADLVDGVIKWGLTAIGGCLMLGLFTPWAAAAAALQLVVFYFASPPLPGLPAATLGGHYLFIDRNLIETIAAGVIAATGSGQWAGLDAFRFRRARKDVAVELTPAAIRRTA